MVSIAEIISVFIQKLFFYMFSHLSLLSVVASEPSRDKFSLIFFSKQLHGYNWELAYSIQILPIDLKQIKM